MQGFATSIDGGDSGSWYNLALISENDDGSDSYSMVLTGLDKGGHYEVRLRAMNRQGWSPLSESFTFSTAGRMSEMFFEMLLKLCLFFFRFIFPP